jgi:tetratricopeptide (TPR) repeat protein
MKAGRTCAWRACGLAAAVLFAAAVARAEPITPRLGLPEATSPLGEFRVDDLEPDEPRLPFYKAQELEVPKPFAITFEFNNPGLKPERNETSGLLLPDRGESAAELSSARQEMMRSLQAGDWTRALEDVQRLLALDPQNAELNRKAGMLYAISGNFALADQHLRVAVLANPRDVAALSARAYVLFNLARFENSLAVARQCEALAPRRLHTQYTLSCLAVAMGGDRSQLAFWRRVTLVEQITLATWLYNDRKELLEVLGAERFAELCSLVLGEGTHANMVLIPDSMRSGRDAVLKGDWAGSLIYFNLAKGYGVEGVFIGQHIARCHYELGRSLDAMKILHGLSITYPDMPEVWYNLGYVLTQTKAYNEGAQAFERCMGLAPDEPLYAFAWACAMAGKGAMDDIWTVLERLDREHPESMPGWMEGSAEYLRAIRADARYRKLKVAELVKP